MLALALALACEPPEVITAPTWTVDIQPMVARNCASCHQEGGLGGFPLVTYDQVSLLSDQVLDSVLSERMPPFLAEPTGCNTLTQSRRLTSTQKEKLSAWIDAGMPYGWERDPTPIPETEVLSEPTEIRYTSPFAPDLSEGDEWRCFVLEGDDTGLRYLQSYSVIPEHPEIVHHVSLFAPTDPDAAQQAREMDQGSGYTCFGDTIVPSMLVAIWSPGQAVYRYPEGTGVRLDDGIPLIAQIHFSAVLGESETESTGLALDIADQVDAPIVPLFFFNDTFALEPGQDSIYDARTQTVAQALSSMGAEQTLTQQAFDIYGAGVHMHLMGTAIQAKVQDGPCLIDVPEWDYGWHDLYFYEEAFRIQRDSQIEVGCTWDTTTASDTVVWGDELQDEMCALMLLASPIE